MANTGYMKREVEDYVRTQLARQFNEPFSSQVLQLSTGGKREFDAVSASGDVVVSIKAHSGLTSGGNLPTGKIAVALNEVYYLTLVEAPVRILLLTNPQFYNLFIKDTEGRIARGVYVMQMNLSPEIQAKVDEVTKTASDEMTRAK
jgi:hypothetical protein